MIAQRTIAAVAAALVAGSVLAAVAAQGQVHTDARIAALIASLDGPAWENAAEELAALGDRAVGPLIEVLRIGKGIAAARACAPLARIGTERAVDAVLDALSAPNPAVREHAAAALGRVKSDRSVAALIVAVNKESWPLQAAAIRSLGDIGDARAAEPLASLLKGRPWYVRDAAIRAVARLAGSAANTTLVAALEDEHGSVRQAAREGLAARGETALGNVIRAFDQGSESVRWQAAWVLGRVKAPGSIEALLRGIEHGSPAVRLESAVGLVRLQSATAVDHLTRLLASRDPAVRDDAAWVLAQIPSSGTSGLAVIAQSIVDTAQRCAPPRSPAAIDAGVLTYRGRRYRLYPETLDRAPDIPAPLTSSDGTELMVTITSSGSYGIVPVTLQGKDRQCEADGADFPTLARSGVHSDAELDRTRTITGRSVVEIAELGRPGYLSDAGFLGDGEKVLSILKDDNRTVRTLGLTHPQLARPLFHIWNAMDTDLRLGRWNMAEHRWGNVTGILSHGRRVQVAAGDTKGTQLSIFADGLEGFFWIEISRDLTQPELAFLMKRYGHLAPDRMDAFVRALTRLRTGEMEPHYIQWYGFYEGRTPWRVDPITIALVFGLRTVEQIEAAFPGRLYDLLMARYVASS